MLLLNSILLIVRLLKGILMLVILFVNIRMIFSVCFILIIKLFFYKVIAFMIVLILVFLIILMLNLRLKLFALGLSELPFKLTFPIVHVSCLDKKISDLISFESRIYNYSIHSVYASIIKTRNLFIQI